MLNTNFVPPVGPEDAKIAFIGQAPGEEEDKLLQGFVGAAGTYILNPALKSTGILRSEILLWNVFHRRPPGNDVSYFYQDKKCTMPTWEGQQHIEETRQWLLKLKKTRDETGQGPNVIVALGREAMLTLTGQEKIWRWRGSLLPCTLVEGFKVYPMFHPSYINRLMNEPEENLQGQKKKQKMNALPLFLRDLQRAKIQSEFPELIRPKRELKILCSFDEYVHLLRQTATLPYVSCDIETFRSKLGTTVWCIGFGLSPELAFSIPIIKNRSFHWSHHEERLLWQEISKLFLNRDVLKVFQYGNYDLTILGRNYGLRVADGSYADTMWCFQATYPYLYVNLAMQTSWYTWEPYYKDEGKWWDGRRTSDEAEYTYNCKDCAVTREIWPIVSAESRQLGSFKTYENHIRSIPSMFRMMIRGVRFDSKKRDELKKIWSDECRVIESKIDGVVGAPVNLDSHMQVQKVIFGFLGLPIIFNKKGKVSVDKDILNRLLKKHPDQVIIKDILRHKKLSKLVSTYTELEAELDDRIRTAYGWVSSFRLNSTESHFGSGGNLQNIPVRTEEGLEIRKLFIPDPGMVLLAADLVQAEAMEVAWLSDDQELIEAFLARVDVHWENAKRIFKLPLNVEYNKTEPVLIRYFDEPILMKKLRDIAKTVVHAGNYGMGPYKLQSILILQGIWLELGLCKLLIEEAARARPLRTVWQQRTAEEVRIGRVLYNCFNDRKEFRGRVSSSLYNSAYSFRPQSVVGRILQFGIQTISEEVELFEPLLNVHDEVVGQCRPEDIEQVKPQIEKALMITHVPNSATGKELTIPCDFKVGPSWGEMREIK